MNETMEVFKRHRGKRITISLKNEDGGKDEFKFKPLNTELYATAMILGPKMDAYGNNPEKVTKDDVKDLMGFFKGIILNSYPDLDDEYADEFVVYHIEDMLSIVEKLMPIENSNSDKNSSAMEKIKKMQKQRGTPKRAR